MPGLMVRRRWKEDLFVGQRFQQVERIALPGDVRFEPHGTHSTDDTLRSLEIQRRRHDATSKLFARVSSGRRRDAASSPRSVHGC